MKKPNQDYVLLVLVFVGAASAVVAASDSVPALYRMIFGAIAAGCGPVVALLQPPKTN